MKYAGIERQKNRWGWIFVLPALLFFLLFSFYPMVNAIYNTFFNMKLLSLAKPDFVGLSNYKYILSSDRFWNSVKLTAIFTLGTFIPLTVLSLLFGLIIATRNRGHRILQLIIYSPAILSSVVSALIWMLFFDPRGMANTVVNAILRTPGVDHRWMTDTVMLQISLIVIYIWRSVGYFSIIFVTGIAKIPQSVYEAATIDGASAFQTIRRIILPLLQPTIVLVSTIAMLNCIKSFSTQYMFFQRGAALDVVNVLTLNIYNTALRDLNISRACVMSILLFLAMMGLTMLRLRSSDKNAVSF
ncbi:MAG: sugar ABC transporter permease [Treponema sp.]|jgi:multiple sugar transport system permease protein|nr:sugar ABC transporter permease [Treponema sp.]